MLPFVQEYFSGRVVKNNPPVFNSSFITPIFTVFPRRLLLEESSGQGRLHAPRQALAGALAQVDDLLARQTQLGGNRSILQGQFVPHLHKFRQRYFQRLRDLPDSRGARVGNQRNHVAPFPVAQIEQKRSPLARRELAHLGPELAQREAQFDRGVVAESCVRQAVRQSALLVIQ